jgi:hypothetical protein
MSNPYRAMCAELTDEELLQMLFDNHRGAIEFLCDAEEEAHLMIRNHVKFARAAIAADRARTLLAQPPADGEVADHVVEVPKKVALTTRYQAHLREDRLFHICDEAQPLIVQWWNESRKSRHGVKATWTEAAWKASVYRVANLPECQQVLLCKAGVEHGWQALKPEYLKDELAKPTGNGRPIPKDPAPHTP